MKTKVTSIITAMLMVISLLVALPMNVWADATEPEEETDWVAVRFNHRVLDDGTLEINEYEGPVTNSPVEGWDRDNCIVPATIEGKTVTVLSKSMFSRHDYPTGENSFKTITIPDTVTTIETGIFDNCFYLTTINVDADNESYSTQDGVLFNKDKTVLIRYPRANPNTSYTIPDTVTAIAPNAFYKCSYLEDLTIPSGVTVLRGIDFIGTKWLSEKQKENPFVIVNRILIDASTCVDDVEIPDGVTAIGDYAFYGVSGIERKTTSVTIPDGVTSIGKYAFKSCNNITTITMTDTVTDIGMYAFEFCDKLKNITLSNSLTTIEMGTFYRTGFRSLTIPEGVTRIDNFAFKSSHYLRTLSLPSSLKEICIDVIDTTNIKDVYYNGTKSMRDNIKIDNNNYLLKSPIWHYISDGEVKYQLRPNDDGTTDTRFILIADEQEVLNTDSASVYATIDGTDTDAIVVDRAYRSIVANGKKITADEGKVFLIGKFVGIPDDMVSGMTAHFTLGKISYDRTIAS